MRGRKIFDHSLAWPDKSQKTWEAAFQPSVLLETFLVTGKVQ